MNAILARIPRAIAVLLGWDDSGKLEKAHELEVEIVRAELDTCRHMGAKNAAAVKVLEAANANLRDQLRRSAADPRDLLDSLAGPKPDPGT